MRQFWVVAPFHAKFHDAWENVWNYDSEHDTISIGWRELGDISTLDEDELLDHIRRTYPDYPPGEATRACRMLHNFHHAVKRGDIVIARRGTKMIAAIGTVTRAGHYDPKKNVAAFEPDYTDIAYPNHLGVRWSDAPRFKPFAEPVFAIQTIYEISEEKFLELSQAPLPAPIHVEEQNLSDNQLDDLIRANLLKIGIVPTDSPKAMARRRKGQQRLRKLTLANYGGQCAVCDVKDRALLVASHIVGWAEAPEHRGDLKNVICLCRAHDALFEAGYWSLGNDLQYLKKKDITSKTLRLLLDGMTSFRSPSNLPPAARFVKRHRKRAGFAP